MRNERVYKIAFSTVYPLLVQKAERKGRTKSEVDAVEVVPIWQEISLFYVNNNGR